MSEKSDHPFRSQPSLTATDPLTSLGQGNFCVPQSIFYTGSLNLFHLWTSTPWILSLTSVFSSNNDKVGLSDNDIKESQQIQIPVFNFLQNAGYEGFFSLHFITVPNIINDKKQYKNSSSYASCYKADNFTSLAYKWSEPAFQKP